MADDTVRRWARRPPLIYGKVLGPVTATSEAGPAAKTGRACSQSILGIAAFGDGSIAAAKRAGGITTVVSVDFESTNVLWGSTPSSARS